VRAEAVISSRFRSSSSVCILVSGVLGLMKGFNGMAFFWILFTIVGGGLCAKRHWLSFYPFYTPLYELKSSLEPWLLSILVKYPIIYELNIRLYKHSCLPIQRSITGTLCPASSGFVSQYRETSSLILSRKSGLANTDCA
jgi:hypothetical protein